MNNTTFWNKTSSDGGIKVGRFNMNSTLLFNCYSSKVGKTYLKESGKENG